MHKVTVKDIPGLDLGDVRRDERLVTIINNISNDPGGSIPKQNKDWYDTKATYDFFKNEGVSIDALKDVIKQYGAKQVGSECDLLVIHDISNISYNNLKAEGLGYLDNKEGRGVLCYSALAASPEGQPLALVYQHTWLRDLKDLGKSSKRKRLPFEDKETYRWYDGMDEVNKLLGSGVRKVHIADREADVFELFYHAFRPHTELLIRARHDRKVADGSHLWTSIAAMPVSGTATLQVPDGTGTKKRAVTADVRYRQVEVLRPRSNGASYESVVLTAIEVLETNAERKDGDDIIHWRLLTTLGVDSLAGALQCVRWYSFRWLIERFHYVLKSGTKVEALQLKKAESLQKAIAVYSLAAFRVMQLVYLSRYHPEASCELVLTAAQWKTLYILINKSPVLPSEPPDLYQAVLWFGRLGGHLGRKSDGPPGLKTVWQGYRQLCNAASVYELTNLENLGKA